MKEKWYFKPSISMKKAQYALAPVYFSRSRFHSSRQGDVILYTRKVKVDFMCFILIAHFSFFFLFDDKKPLSYGYTFSHLFLIPALTHMRQEVKSNEVSKTFRIIFTVIHEQFIRPSLSSWLVFKKCLFRCGLIDNMCISQLVAVGILFFLTDTKGNHVCFSLLIFYLIKLFQIIGTVMHAYLNIYEDCLEIIETFEFCLIYFPMTFLE